MPIDEEWIKDWYVKLDRSSRFNAITELRLAAERQVLDVNREIGDQEKEFSRAILEVFSFLDAEAKPENLEERFLRAQELGEALQALGAKAQRLQKEYEAFAQMEQRVSRGG